MPKSHTAFAAGCIAAAAALTLATAQPRAEHDQGPDRLRPGGPGMMMAQAPGPQGQMMGTGPQGQKMGPGGRSGSGRAMESGGYGRDDHRSWRERRRERRRARRMEILDTNNDGKVTLAEIEGELKRLIAAADVDGDGTLSADEFRRRGRWFLRLRTVSFFDILDANGDGQVSAAEITGPTGRWFTRQDENKDKALTGEEFNKSSWYHGARRWYRRR